MQRFWVKLQEDRPPTIALALIGLLVIIGYIGVFLEQRAYQKWFWADEGLNLVATCSDSVGTQLVQGARGQCSPHPLYYVLERSFLRSSLAANVDLLLRARFLSIAAAGGALMALWILFTYFGFPIIGVIAALALSVQNVFQFYAIEARPYALWVFCFSLALLATFFLPRKQEKYFYLRWSFFIFATVSLTLVAAPGFMQAMGFCAAAGIARFITGDRNGNRLPWQSWPWALGAMALLVGVIGYYYAVKGCVHGYDAEPFDLLKSKDWSLLLGLVRLFIPKVPLWATPLHLLFFAGALSAAYLCLPRSSKLFPDQQYSQWRLLAIVLVLQTIIIGFMAGAVAYSHYYFVQRMFLPAAVLGAVLVGFGTWLAFRFLPRLRIALGAYCLIVLALLVNHIVENGQAVPAKAPLAIENTTLVCQEGNPLRLWFSTDPKADSQSRPLNEFVLLQRLRRSCLPGHSTKFNPNPKDYFLQHEGAITKVIPLESSPQSDRASLALCASELLVR